MRRAARILGTLMIVAGLGSIGWAVVVWQWQDPFTAIYTKYQQDKLASSYEERLATYSLPPAQAMPARPSPVDATRDQIAVAAASYRETLREGDPVGRLKVPRLGLEVMVVNGTATDDLAKGPGRELHTFMPGEGELVYIAGHRTTYSAPFAHIDKLKPGDRFTFELPYATFEYEITGHKIVRADRVDVLRSNHREVVALQACHPRFFASHRWIAYAKPVSASLRTRDGSTAPAGAIA